MPNLKPFLLSLGCFGIGLLLGRADVRMPALPTSPFRTDNWDERDK